MSPTRQAAPIRTGDERATLDAIDARVRALARSLGACEMQYPALIAREVLERAEYPNAFPHLLLTASELRRPEAGHQHLDDQVPTHWCLSPAVCYHTYAHLAGRVIDHPLAFTARGRCFRNEETTQPGIRQIEFEMREIVLVDTPGSIDISVALAQRQIELLADELGLPGNWCVAEDPFFLPLAQGKALMQKLARTKLEYRSCDSSGVALVSVNRHGTFFGQRFDITTRTGQPARTACIAMGLDRWLAKVSDRRGGCEQDDPLQEVTTCRH